MKNFMQFLPPTSLLYCIQIYYITHANFKQQAFQHYNIMFLILYYNCSESKRNVMNVSLCIFCVIIKLT